MFCAVSKCITSTTPQAAALGAAVGGMDSGRLNGALTRLTALHKTHLADKPGVWRTLPSMTTDGQKLREFWLCVLESQTQLQLPLSVCNARILKEGKLAKQVRSLASGKRGAKAWTRSCQCACKALIIKGGGGSDISLPAAQARLETLLPLSVRLCRAKGDGSCFLRCVAQACPDDTTRNARNLQNLSVIVEHALGVDADDEVILRTSVKFASVLRLSQSSLRTLPQDEYSLMNYRALQSACKLVSLKAMKNAKSLHFRSLLRSHHAKDVCSLLNAHFQDALLHESAVASTTLADTRSTVFDASRMPSLSWLLWNPWLATPEARKNQNAHRQVVDSCSLVGHRDLATCTRIVTR
eukprot:4511016-Amphidinium_carterae.1